MRGLSALRPKLPASLMRLNTSALRTRVWWDGSRVQANAAKAVALEDDGVKTVLLQAMAVT
jgi:hypothetical protein